MIKQLINERNTSVEKKRSMLTRHGERDKPKSWSHRSRHQHEPLRPHLHQLTGKDFAFTDPFSLHTPPRSLRLRQTDMMSTRQCGIRASYALRWWKRKSALRLKSWSFSAIFTHKHERDVKRSLGFSLVHANWLTRSRQTVRFSCARWRLDIRERNQANNLCKNKSSTT